MTFARKMNPDKNASGLHGKLTALIVLVSLLIVLNVITLSVSVFRLKHADAQIPIPNTHSGQSDPFGFADLPRELEPSNRRPQRPIVVDPELARKIDQSTAILLTENEERDGKIFSKVFEVLKLDPDVAFYYEVGDVMGPPIEAKSGTRYGEGQVVFCEGSPATMRSATSIHRGRAPGLGDMPLSILREIVKQAEGEQNGADQPATASESKPEGNEIPKPESEGRSQ